MSRRPKSDYAGRGINFQARLSDEEHREFDRQRKAAGFDTLVSYFRHMMDQASKKVITPIAQDPIRPENRNIHKRFEGLWNSLDDGDRTQLERLLEAYRPKTKGKRAS